MTFIWFDGGIRPAAEAGLSLWNHSLHYGFGVFEGLRAYPRSRRPAIFRLDDHVRRLHRSAELIGLDVPYDTATVIAAHHEVLEANRLTTAYLRPLVYLGDGLDGLKGTGISSHLAVLAWTWEAPPGDGFSLALPGIRKPGADSVPLQAKATGSYLVSKIANARARNLGFDDAILLDREGWVCEATAQNIFAVIDGRLLTPPGDSCLLGITRDTVLRLAASLGIPAVEKRISVSELMSAEEVFLTSTAVGVRAVTRIESRQLPAGSVTGRLTVAYRDLVSGANEFAKAHG